MPWEVSHRWPNLLAAQLNLTKFERVQPRDPLPGPLCSESSRSHCSICTQATLLTMCDKIGRGGLHSEHTATDLRHPSRTWRTGWADRLH